jgi:hypothetical protein
VLFVPKNLKASPSDLEAIDRTLDVIQKWYADQLEGRTFRYEKTVEVQGNRELRWYCPETIVEDQCIQVPGVLGAEPRNIWRVFNDLAEQNYRMTPSRILLVFWVGGYGYAAGSQSADGGGFAAVGDWTIQGILGNYETLGRDAGRCGDSPGAHAYCTWNASIGSIAHELGHAFGLPHPWDDGTGQEDPNWWLSSLMSVHWDFPNVVLLDSDSNPEKEVLRNNPFLRHKLPAQE